MLVREDHWETFFFFLQNWGDSDVISVALSELGTEVNTGAQGEEPVLGSHHTFVALWAGAKGHAPWTSQRDPKIGSFLTRQMNWDRYPHSYGPSPYFFLLKRSFKNVPTLTFLCPS